MVGERRVGGSGGGCAVASFPSPPPPSHSLVLGSVSEPSSEPISCGFIPESGVKSQGMAQVTARCQSLSEQKGDGSGRGRLPPFLFSPSPSVSEDRLHLNSHAHAPGPGVGLTPSLDPRAVTVSSDEGEPCSRATHPPERGDPIRGRTAIDSMAGAVPGSRSPQHLGGSRVGVLSSPPARHICARE